MTNFQWSVLIVGYLAGVAMAFAWGWVAGRDSMRSEIARQRERDRRIYEFKR